MGKSSLLGLIIAACLLNGYSGVSIADDPYYLMKVDPADTGSGINAVIGDDYKHWIYQPLSDIKKNVLIVFLGGAASYPSQYSTITAYAASLGYFVIDLRWLNDVNLGVTCALSIPCFTKFRAETSYGQNIAYGTMTGQNSSALSINAANSIVNRIVAAIHYMATSSSTAGSPWSQSDWAQFITADSNSPYSTSTLGTTSPDWSKIVLAGHSQGSGNSAFIAVHLAAATPARRVVLFSGPNDRYGSGSWLEDSSSTDMARFWALRSEDEGTYGGDTTGNWCKLGGPVSGTTYDHGVGDVHCVDTLPALAGTCDFSNGDCDYNIGDGSHFSPFPPGISDPNYPPPTGQQRLFFESDHISSNQHNSTAADEIASYGVTREPVWKYLFTANGTD